MSTIPNDVDNKSESEPAPFFHLRMLFMMFCAAMIIAIFIASFE
jgi:hypothetical protein